MNIDLKGFTEDFYHMVGGRLDTVKRTIVNSVDAGVHVEVTTLIIPGLNDSEEEIGETAAWLAGLDPDLTYHITRAFPCFKMTDFDPPAVSQINRLVKVAKRSLPHVYPGNC